MSQQKSLDSPDIQARLKKIKLLILDVYGVMTDGRVNWLAGHGWSRHFHIKDGYGLKVLMKCGIDVAIISGGERCPGALGWLAQRSGKSPGIHAGFLGCVHADRVGNRWLPGPALVPTPEHYQSS